MYLTVKEAIDASNKSQTTIHRLCQKYENTKYVKKEGNKYLIDKDFLFEKYPIGSEDIMEPDTNLDDNLIVSLTEKNKQITELTIKNKELEDKIFSLEEDKLENAQEIAEILDANMSLNKELQALKSKRTIQYSESGEYNDLKETFYKALIITGSVALLIAFIFSMYYFTF